MDQKSSGIRRSSVYDIHHTGQVAIGNSDAIVQDDRMRLLKIENSLDDEICLILNRESVFYLTCNTVIANQPAFRKECCND